VEPDKYLQEYTLHPKGHSLVLTVRGKPFVMGNWEGAVIQRGETQGVRYRLTRFLHDGERLVTVSDASGEERLELHLPDGSVTRYEQIDIGHAYWLEVSPVDDRVALTNHRFELLLIDLQTGTYKVVDKAEHSALWSAFFRDCGGSHGRPTDAGWLMASPPTSAPRLSNSMTHKRRPTTLSPTPEFRDILPDWDPDGELLYFVSYRDL
jgi:tricorn protease